ncbi:MULTISPECIES: hypothetical protein [Bradyrhizobium]|nr:MULTISPECIES: hypothetical protein [Bradyrhizobium]MBB4399259.1 small nuclear ribonucleoprotein (snRNP)-like protein [Bradyrhizobium sp. ERR14]
MSHDLPFGLALEAEITFRGRLGTLDMFANLAVQEAVLITMAEKDSIRRA